MLKIKNLYKSYKKDVNVLEDVNLEVDSGDIFAFIGHNGAGKTTTIKCVIGILNYEQGEIYVNDTNIKEAPLESKKIIAYVPDNPDIYEYMTGIEFLEFILSMYDIQTQTKKDKIEALAKMYEIYDNLGTKIKEYSHGMKQKLVLISAFIREPKLMILDEPFVGLDPKASKETKDLMKKFCENGGAIFFSTHVLETAERLCNKVAIIKKGKIIASGEMKEIIKDKTLEDVFLEDVNE